MTRSVTTSTKEYSLLLVGDEADRVMRGTGDEDGGFGIDAVPFAFFADFFSPAGDLDGDLTAAAAAVTEVLFMPMTNSDPGLLIVWRRRRGKGGRE